MSKDNLDNSVKNLMQLYSRLDQEGKDSFIKDHLLKTLYISQNNDPDTVNAEQAQSFISTFKEIMKTRNPLSRHVNNVIKEERKKDKNAYKDIDEYLKPQDAKKSLKNSMKNAYYEFSDYIDAARDKVSDKIKSANSKILTKLPGKISHSLKQKRKDIVKNI